MESMDSEGKKAVSKETRESNNYSYEITLDGSVDFKGRPSVRAKSGKWKACYYLIGYEVFERMAFYGIASNLVIYLTKGLHEGTVSSARNVNNWSGAVWMTPILGAYVADSYLGRYWTFLISSFIYLLGMALLTLSVSLKLLKPPPCDVGAKATLSSCKKASPLQIGFFFMALYVLAVGTGGTKPNISTFGADQFDDFYAKEKLQKNSFFNWWMFSVFFGALVAQSVMVYLQENVGWGLGYGIPTFGLFVSVIIFMLGTPMYRYKKVNKSDNPINRVIRALVAAVVKWKVPVPADPSQLYDVDEDKECNKRRIFHTNTLRFLDKAATRSENVRWPLCTVTQVEETKQMIGMVPVWLVTLIPSTILAQINTFFVKQGTTMDRHILGHSRSFQVPAASLGVVITLSTLIFVPIYDRLFVPLMRRYTGNPRGITLLQRMGIGFVIQILVMVIASAVEVKRLQVISQAVGIQDYGSEQVPMSILWLLPQYLMMGVADVFTTIAMLEFFYDQSPAEMQSLGTAYFTSSLGLGNFISSSLVTTVEKVTTKNGGLHDEERGWITNNLNHSHLDYYYALLALLCFVNIIFFCIVAKFYVYKRHDDEDGRRQPAAGNPENSDLQVVRAEMDMFLPTMKCQAEDQEPTNRV